MTLSHRQQIFARNVAKLLEHIFSKGYGCTLGEAYRTKEQAEIYAAKGIGIKNSLHCVRLAIDLNLFLDGIYLATGTAHLPFGRYWESLHPDNRWGGNWDKDENPLEPGENDGNHYEMSMHPKTPEEV